MKKKPLRIPGCQKKLEQPQKMKKHFQYNHFRTNFLDKSQDKIRLNQRVIYTFLIDTVLLEQSQRNEDMFPVGTTICSTDFLD